LDVELNGHQSVTDTIADNTNGESRAFVDRILRPFQQFVATESAGGLLLILSATLGLAWANSPYGNSYFALWDWNFTIGPDGFALSKPLSDWINDGLMVLFFLLVGLEIKREVFVGELSSIQHAALPIAAALGGMIVPAAIYAAINAGGDGARGWGIPMATDIAFALGALSIFGSRIPTGLRLFLAALAIVDDIGAVLVIALFYTAQFSAYAAGAAVVAFALLLLCNRAGIRHPGIYAGLGALLWLAVLKSGVHPTIAGVLLAIAIPARTRIDEDTFGLQAESALFEFQQASTPDARSVMSNPGQQEALHRLERAIEGVQSPLLRIEHNLNRIVAFGVVPLFAFANAGVRFSAETFNNLAWRVLLGVVFGLVVGKVTGIFLAARLAVRLRVAALPAQVTWRAVFGVGWLGGIGFTMSLFIATLAFGDGPQLDSAKLGILAGSIVSACVGTTILRKLPRTVEQESPVAEASSRLATDRAGE
jgi:NhaA family Na+:H+ antiporter